MNNLQFRQDGSFKIVQFSDTEFCEVGILDQKKAELATDSMKQWSDDDITERTMQSIIAYEKPDLIVITGDVIASEHLHNPVEVFHRAARIMDQTKTPWAVIFGNHDSESSSPRYKLHDAQLEYAYNVALPDPPNVSGVGNYRLPIFDREGEEAFGLFFMDSGDYSRIGEQVGGYDWIQADQIGWYRSESEQAKVRNGGIPLPSLSFLHIPFPEYNEVWEHHVCYGHRLDGCCSSPQVNSGLFSAMLEMNNMLGVFVGHDHSNDFCGILHGIKLCYGRSTRYVSYVDGKRDDYFPTGARVIELREGVRDFQTWIREADGNQVVQQPEHLPVK